MMERSISTAYAFDRPGVYEIHVVGTVNTQVLKYLDGMQRKPSLQADAPYTNVIILTGWLQDQAALNGVLNTLYNHGLTLALVRQVEYRAASDVK